MTARPFESSALEITTKLCDDDFARKAKAADFYTRTWDLFIEAGSGKGQDKARSALKLGGEKTECFLADLRYPSGFLCGSRCS